MSEAKYIALCSSCIQNTRIGVVEELEQHLKATNQPHRIMKMDKLHEKCLTLQSKIESTTQKLVQLKKAIVIEVQQLTETVFKLRDSFLMKIDEVIDNYWSTDQVRKDKQMTARLLKKRQFEHFLCIQMHQIIEYIQKIVKDKDFVKKEKPKAEKKVCLLISQFQSHMKKCIQNISLQRHFKAEQQSSMAQTISSISKQTGSNFLSQHTQMAKLLEISLESEDSSQVQTIMQFEAMKKKTDLSKNTKDKNSIESSRQQKSNSILQDIKIPQKSFKSKKSWKPQIKPEKIQNYKKHEKREFQIKSEKRESFVKIEIKEHQASLSGQLSSFLKSSYFQQQSKSQVISPQLLEEIQYSRQPQRIIEDSDHLSSTQQQNQSELNQTLIKFQKEILNNDQNSFKDEKLTFLTIQQLQRLKKLQGTFNVKVAIIKILYYSVLDTSIPKVKFIAGDHTGYGLFFTNYCPDLKAKTQLQMQQCKFNLYKGSYEIINQNKFRIMREFEPKITPNLKGCRLNKVITHDLYYPLEDKRCTLIRQVAEILKSGKSTNYLVRKMTVEVVTVISESSSGAFCIVGDSSGMIMAYLKKETPKSISSLDIVRLQDVRGIRGICKHLEQKEQVIFIDSSSKRSRVLAHPFHKFHDFQFVQISQDMMSLN